MVARLLRLRIALALAPLRSGFRQALIAILSRLLLLAVAVCYALTPLWLSHGDGVRLAQLDVVFGSVMLLGAFLAGFSVRSAHADARALQPFPYRPTAVAIALLSTGLATWWGLAAMTWAVTFVSTRSSVHPWPLMLVVVVFAVVSALILSRIGGGLAGLLSQVSRTTSLQRVINALLLTASIPILLLMLISTAREDGTGQLSDTVEMLSWTPVGAPFALLLQTPSMPMFYGISVASIALLIAVIISVTNILLERTDFPASGVMQQSTLGWFDYLPYTPTMTIGARSLTYWFRDPRYLVSLIAIPFIPALVVGVLLIAGMDLADLAIIPLTIVLVMLGWMVHNDIATDSTAFWIHVASGTTGLQDRVGRLIPVFVLGVPVLVIGTSITVLAMGNWQAFPAVFAVGGVALCVSSGVSSVASALRPYPTTRPGESPFIQPAWQGSGAGATQTFSLLGIVALVAPPVVAILLQSEMGFGQSLLLSGITLLYGLVILGIGSAIGALLYNRRNSELLAFTQVFD